MKDGAADSADVSQSEGGDGMDLDAADEEAAMNADAEEAAMNAAAEEAAMNS